MKAKKFFVSAECTLPFKLRPSIYSLKGILLPSSHFINVVWEVLSGKTSEVPRVVYIIYNTVLISMM